MEMAAKKGRFHAYFPPKSLCTDNAAMIAALAYWNLREGRDVAGPGNELDARPR
jgi:tRNA A37 threonylcarbamoyltransferase TsaD